MQLYQNIGRMEKKGGTKNKIIATDEGGNIKEYVKNNGIDRIIATSNEKRPPNRRRGSIT